jgi:hypothetical protein
MAYLAYSMELGFMQTKTKPIQMVFIKVEYFPNLIVCFRIISGVCTELVSQSDSARLSLIQSF